MRELAAIVGDKLAGDPCLADYLDDPNIILRHGTAYPCTQPAEAHNSQPIRREQQTWPSDFCNAVVTFGQFSRSPAVLLPGPRSSWTFRVGIFVHDVVRVDGVDYQGDLWCLDIYAMVIRILEWEKERRSCTDQVLVVEQFHEGDQIPHEWYPPLRAWRIVTRFRWNVIQRGILPPSVSGCCA